MPCWSFKMFNGHLSKFFNTKRQHSNSNELINALSNSNIIGICGQKLNFHTFDPIFFPYVISLIDLCSLVLQISLKFSELIYL